MKKAINNDGLEVEVEDGVTVRTVNGIHHLLTPAENTEQSANQAAWDLGAERRAALKELGRLEGCIAPRRLREAVLGTDNGWLAAQEALIAIERAKL